MRLRNYSVTCKSICSYYNLVYNFLMQLFSLESLVFVVQFLNAFRHGKETFPKSSSQNEIVPLLIVFHLPYSKYKDVKICFYSCRHQKQNFSPVSHSCRSCSAHAALVSLVQNSCRTCVTFMSHPCFTRVAHVALVSLVLHLCCIRAALVWHSCCKLDQIYKDVL